MKVSVITLFVLLFCTTGAQDLHFSNTALQTYLLSQNTVDLNGDEFAETGVDLNQDKKITVAEALPVKNMVLSPGGSASITSIRDLQHFSNLQRLTVLGGFSLAEISGLGLDSLEFLRVSDHNSIRTIDLSDLPSLKAIYLEGLNGVQFLNLQNGSAANLLSLFYTYIQSACVDSIAAEYNTVAEHIKTGGHISTGCSAGIPGHQLKLLKVYPNPSTATFRFSEEVDRAALFDLNGRQIRSWNAPVTTLDLSSLSPGVYFIRATQDTQAAFVQHIIKSQAAR